MEGLEKYKEAININFSIGKGKGGKKYAYIRPKANCFNRDRKVGGFTKNELRVQIIKCIEKYYFPIRYYELENHIIGANNEDNALKEYWRVCDLKDVGKQFVIKNINK